MTGASGRGDALKVSLAAGFGSTFVFLIYEGLARFWNLERAEKFYEIALIALVWLGFVAFIEPLLDRFKSCFIGASASESEPAGAEHWSMRLAALLILLLADVSRAFIHEVVTERIHSGGVIEVEQLLESIAAPGLITWFWIRGARRQPPRAARNGLFSGIVLGTAPLIIALARAWFVGSQQWAVTPDLASVRRWIEPSLALLLWNLPYAGAGLVGGLMIDRWSGARVISRRPSRVIGPALLIGALVEGAVLFAAGGFNEFELVSPLLVPVIGWWLGLMLYPQADELLAAHLQPSPILNPAIE